MNFKPTSWKSVVSILIGIFVDYYFASHITCVVLENVGNKCPSVVRMMLDGWWSVLIVALIVYIIWSFIERGNKRK